MPPATSNTDLARARMIRRHPAATPIVQVVTTGPPARRPALSASPRLAATATLPRPGGSAPSGVDPDVPVETGPALRPVADPGASLEGQSDLRPAADPVAPIEMRPELHTPANPAVAVGGPGEDGSLVTEYGLVALLGATIAGLAIKWAAGGAIWDLFNSVMQKALALVGV